MQIVKLQLTKLSFEVCTHFRSFEVNLPLRSIQPLFDSIVGHGMSESKEYASSSMLTHVCGDALAKSGFLSCSVYSLPEGFKLMYL